MSSFLSRLRGEKPEKEKQKKAPVTHSPQSKLNQNTKYVLLIHKSKTEREAENAEGPAENAEGKSEDEVVKLFVRALTSKAESVDVTNVNIAVQNQADKVENVTWLNKANNAVLIIFTADTIGEMRNLCEENGYVEEDSQGISHMHGKVFAVSFGQGLDWPPEGIRYDVQGQRHVAFKFNNVEQLKSPDFRNSPKMNTLIHLIQGAQ